MQNTSSKTVISTGGPGQRSAAEKPAVFPDHQGTGVRHPHRAPAIRVGSRKVPIAQSATAESGFTLIELMVVMIIIATLAAIAVPAYAHHLRVARETVLRSDLQVMRQAIDSYTVDKQKAPQSLDDLVTAGYLKTMPIDPITHSATTWTGDRSDTYSSVDQTETGINDVHSGSGLASTEGTSYSTW